MNIVIYLRRGIGTDLLPLLHAFSAKSDPLHSLPLDPREAMNEVEQPWDTYQCPYHRLHGVHQFEDQRLITGFVHIKSLVICQAIHDIKAEIAEPPCRIFRFTSESR